jgi:hypothetical protein
MLRRLENFTFFAAMLLVIVLEAGCVYWLTKDPSQWLPTRASMNSVLEWAKPIDLLTPTTYQCSLLIVIGMLLIKFARIVVPPKAWSEQQVIDNKRTFFRIWWPAMVLLILQGFDLYLAQGGGVS